MLFQELTNPTPPPNECANILRALTDKKSKIFVHIHTCMHVMFMIFSHLQPSTPRQSHKRIHDEDDTEVRE